MTPEDDFTHDDDRAHNRADGTEGEWVSSEPPVDDFGDEPQAETATVSEGDDHDHEEQTETTSAEKKKFPFLLLIGALGSLGIVGGLAYWHFMPKQDPQVSVLDMAAKNVLKESAPAFASKPATAAIEKPAVPVVPAAVEVAPKTGYSVPTMTPPPASAAAPAVEKKPTEEVTAPEAWPTVVPAPSDEPAPKQVAVVQAAVPAPAQNNQADDQRLAALSGRIDDLQKSLGLTAQQLTQINDKLSKNTGAAQAPAQNNSALEDRLNQLEQKLMQMQQQPKAVREAPVHDDMVENVIPVHSKKTKHAAVHVSAHHKKVHVAAKPNRWVLRSAAPDEAWIAKDAKTRQLRPVHVGDNVESIGKVTAIQQVGDTWVVQGSHGTIR